MDREPISNPLGRLPWGNQEVLFATPNLGSMRSVELFAGAGGLALGFEMSGFKSEVVVEKDVWACDTVRENRATGYPLVAGWNVHEGLVEDYPWESIPGGIDLVTGGPPCQPFSHGGKAAGPADSRDGFPAAAQVVEALSPRAFVFENVRGLLRAQFANYFSYVLLRLQMPESVARDDEEWETHLGRLQSEATSAHGVGLRYT